MNFSQARKSIIIRFSIITFFGAIVFWFLWWSASYAASDPEIDVSVLLQDLVLKEKDAGDRARMVDAVIDGRDLFRSSLAFETYNQAQSHTLTLDRVYEHLTSTYTYCPGWLLYVENDDWIPSASEVYLHPDPNTRELSQIQLSKKDVVNIYTLNSQWTEALWLLNNQRSFQFEDVKEVDDAYLNSCKWIVWCEQWMKRFIDDGTRIENDELIWTSTQELDSCQRIVSDLFDLYEVQISWNLEYDDQRDRDVYYNTNLEEDRLQICDVNLELETIAKTFSSDVQDFPRYSAFDPQSVPKNSENNEPELTLPSEYRSEPEDVPEESTFDTIIKDIPYNSVPDDTNTKEVTANYLWLNAGAKNVVWPSWATDWASDRLVTKPKEWGLASLISTPRDWSGAGWSWVIINPQCEVSEIPPEDDPIDLFAEAKDLTETIIAYTDDLDKNERLSQALANDQLLSASEQEAHSIADEPVIPSWDLQNDLDEFLEKKELTDDPELLDTLKQMEDDIKWCIEEFTDEDAESRVQQMREFIQSSYEVRECIQEVLCKEITDPSWRGLYSIRFCSEIEKGVALSTVRRVTSIGDTFFNLKAVLDSVNNSGRTLKHKQATEAFEGQVADLKLKDLFSFTLDVSTRSWRITRDPKVQKRIQEKELAEIQKVVLWEYDNLSVIEPFATDALLYSEMQANAIAQDRQTARDLQWSVNQANAIIDELDESKDDLHKYYERLYNYEQIKHGSLVMKDHIAFWDGFLQISEELRDELQKHEKTMK